MSGGPFQSVHSLAHLCINLRVLAGVVTCSFHFVVSAETSGDSGRGLISHRGETEPILHLCIKVKVSFTSKERLLPLEVRHLALFGQDLQLLLLLELDCLEPMAA